MRWTLLLVCLGICLTSVGVRAEEPAGEPITAVEFQPLATATTRLLSALQFQGTPLPAADSASLQQILQTGSGRDGVIAIQKLLDPHCLALVRINPEGRVSVAPGPVPKQLIQQGWRTFLVKVHNEAGVTGELKVGSPQSGPTYQQGKHPRERPQTADKLVTAQESEGRFLDMDAQQSQPLTPKLSGLAVEYRLVQLFSRDKGQREATLIFDVGQGTQDLGFRNETPILFNCLPSTEVVLDVLDHDGQPTSAAFTIKDGRGRVYPHPKRRLAPDFSFTTRSTGLRGKRSLCLQVSTPSPCSADQSIT